MRYSDDSFIMNKPFRYSAEMSNTEIQQSDF